MVYFWDLINLEGYLVIFKLKVDPASIDHNLSPLVELVEAVAAFLVEEVDHSYLARSLHHDCPCAMGSDS